MLSDDLFIIILQSFITTWSVLYYQKVVFHYSYTSKLTNNKHLLSLLDVKYCIAGNFRKAKFSETYHSQTLWK